MGLGGIQPESMISLASSSIDAAKNGSKESNCESQTLAHVITPIRQEHLDAYQHRIHSHQHLGNPEDCQNGHLLKPRGQCLVSLMMLPYNHNMSINY